MLTGGSSEDKEALKDFQEMKDTSEQSPLQDIENFPLKQSSTFSSKSSDKESTPSDKKLGSSVTGNDATKSSAEHTDGGTAFSFSSNGNRESKDATVVDVGLQDNHSSGLRHRSTSSPNRAKVQNITATVPSDKKERHESQGLISSQFFSYICSIYKEEGFGETDSYQKINSPHNQPCLYDMLFLQGKNKGTLLHVAVRKNKVDYVKGILHILDELCKSDSPCVGEYSPHKVINTKNEEGKDVITLVIEGNNPECISAVFKYLTRKDINRRKDIESGCTLLHEAVRLKSSNAVRELLKSEHVDIELLDERSYKARKYIKDKGTAKLFIDFYDDKITNLRKRLEDSNIQLEQARRTLHRRKSIFAYSAAISFCALLIGAIVNMENWT